MYDYLPEIENYQTKHETNNHLDLCSNNIHQTFGGYQVIRNQNFPRL